MADPCRLARIECEGTRPPFHVESEKVWVGLDASQTSSSPFSWVPHPSSFTRNICSVSVGASQQWESIKLEGILWINASGKWLAHATQEEMFVPLELAAVREAIRTARKLRLAMFPRTSCVHPLKQQCTPSSSCCHSCALDQHHCLGNTSRWCRPTKGTTGQSTLAMDSLRSIRHTATREIDKAVVSAPETDVLILGNHGLVVCEHDCDTAEKLLREVEQRLAIATRPFPKPDTTVATIARSSRWQFPDVDSLHALATDEVSLEAVAQPQLASIESAS